MDQLIEDYKALGYTKVSEVETPTGTGYYMENKNGASSVYLPPNAENATAFVGLHPGSSNPYAGESQSGNGNYKFYINDTIKTGNAPEGTIILMANNMNDYTSQPKAVDVAMDNGVPLTNVGVMDYSYSGRTGMLAAGNISAAHPELEIRVANIDASMLDAYNQGVYRDLHQDGWNHEAVSANLNNNVTVVSIVPDNDHPGYENVVNIKSAIIQMGRDGHESYMISSTSNRHETYHHDFIEGGGIEWLIGQGDLESDKYIKVQKYDPETDSWVDSSVNELKKSYQAAEEAQKKALSLTAKDGAVKVKYDSVVNSLNGIVNNVNSTSYTSSSTRVNGANSSAEIFGNLSSSNSYLFGISSNLVSGIANDVNNIQTILSNWQQTDADLATLASQLNGASYSTSYGANGVTMDSVKFSEISNNYTSFLSSPVREGTVGKVSMSDIKSVFNGSSLTGSLGNLYNSEIQDAKNLQTSIQGLINNPDISSDGWNVMLDRLNFYDKCCGIRGWAAETMKAAYEKALKLIYDHIAPDEDMDDGDIPEYEEKITNLKKDIEEARTAIINLKISNGTLANVKPTPRYSKDKKGNYYFSGYDYAEYNQAQRQIAINKARIIQLEKNITIAEEAKLEAEKYLKRLKELSVKMQEANDIINDAMDQVESKYASEVYHIDTPRVQAIGSRASRNITSSVTPTGSTSITSTAVTPKTASSVASDQRSVASAQSQSANAQASAEYSSSVSPTGKTNITRSSGGVSTSNSNASAYTASSSSNSNGSNSKKTSVVASTALGVAGTALAGTQASAASAIEAFTSSGGTSSVTGSTVSGSQTKSSTGTNGGTSTQSASSGNSKTNTGTTSRTTQTTTTSGTTSSGKNVTVEVEDGIPTTTTTTTRTLPNGEVITTTRIPEEEFDLSSIASKDGEKTTTVVEKTITIDEVKEDAKVVDTTTSPGPSLKTGEEKIIDNEDYTYKAVKGDDNRKVETETTTTTVTTTTTTTPSGKTETSITTTTETQKGDVTTITSSGSGSQTVTPKADSGTASSTNKTTYSAAKTETKTNTNSTGTNTAKTETKSVNTQTAKTETRTTTGGSTKVETRTNNTQNNRVADSSSSKSSSSNRSSSSSSSNSSSSSTGNGNNTSVNTNVDTPKETEVKVDTTTETPITTKDEFANEINIGNFKDVLDNEKVTSTVTTNSEDVNTNVPKEKSNNKGNTIVTAGIAATGLGLAAGAVAYGVKETKKEQNEDEEEEVSEEQQ